MRKYLSILVSVVVIAAFGFIVYTQWNKTPAPVAQEQLPATTTAPAVTETPRPKATITAVTLGKRVGADGIVNMATTTFGTKDNIYAGLTLQNALARTEISYIRTFNGQYIDSKVSHPTKDGVTNFYFSWILNAGKVRKVGNYTLMFYVDGVKSQTVSYTVK